MPPVTVYWEDNVQGDAYLPPGMSADAARKIPGTGPPVGPFGLAEGPTGAARGAAAGVRAGAAAQPGGRGGFARSSGYNCIFVGSKGYLGTSGRGEGVGLLPGSRWAAWGPCTRVDRRRRRAPRRESTAHTPLHIWCTYVRG